MTCIVAVETPAGVWMGGDRAVSGTWTSQVKATPKVWTNGPLLIGTCGSVRLPQILRYGMTPPLDALTWDVDRWVAIDFVRAVRAAFAEHGFDRVRDGIASGGLFLLAVRGRLYEIQSDYSFIRHDHGEHAIGSGEDHAFGSLHSTREWDDPRVRITAALEAAAEHVMSVAGPFDIEFQETP